MFHSVCQRHRRLLSVVQVSEPVRLRSFCLKKLPITFCLVRITQSATTGWIEWLVQELQWLETEVAYIRPYPVQLIESAENASNEFHWIRFLEFYSTFSRHLNVHAPRFTSRNLYRINCRPTKWIQTLRKKTPLEQEENLIRNVSYPVFLP